MERWIQVCDAAALPAGGHRVVRDGRAQVLVGRLGDGALFAIDNRCPHEGYPLSQGGMEGCTLTCRWHNFKFDVRTGACLKGDEAVQTYPLRVTDAGTVEVDLTPPDPAAAIPGLWRSLGEALSERRVGQSVRDAARLLEAGVPPADLAAAVAAWDGTHAEYGSTHVLALAADVLRWLPRYPGVRFAIPLAQVLDLASLGGVRRPERPPVPPRDPGPDPHAAGVALRAAVEAEDAEGAEALLLGALARGWGREVISPWLFLLCADHFLDFGHRLIYQLKMLDLLDAVGWQHPSAAPILRGHLLGIVNGTREDLRPPWAAFGRRLQALDLAALYALPAAHAWTGRPALLQALLDGRPAEAFEAVTEALRQGAGLPAVVDTLSLAAAERMLRFDVTIDSDPGNQDTWLSVSHIQTFCSAVRHALDRFAQPEVLRLVYMAARFINHHRVLDRPADQQAPIQPAAGLPDGAAALDAVRLGRADEALSQVLALWSDPGAGLGVLLEGLEDLVVSDRFAVPIVSAHAMKNLVVARIEAERLGDPRPLLAAVRMLAGPLQQRWTHRGALEAVAFVTEGRIPTLLAP